MSTRKRVLLIEDHDDSRCMIAKMLRRSGYAVHAYDHCDPAAAHLAANDVDIALLDVRLPDRCGDDFAKEFRRRCPGAAIVFLTGEDILEPLKQAVPGCYVMRKPVDLHVLVKLLECLDDSHATEAADVR